MEQLEYAIQIDSEGESTLITENSLSEIGLTIDRTTKMVKINVEEYKWAANTY